MAPSFASGSTSAAGWSTSTSRCRRFYGSLPVGDELALAANPTLVSRLTGAAPDEVRRVARTAKTRRRPPAAPELYEEIARLMGLEP